MMRQVGRIIASAMRRTSDIVARSRTTVPAAGVSMEEGRAREHAEQHRRRIRALAIHHPRSRTGRYLTVSVGVVTSAPPRDRGV